MRSIRERDFDDGFASGQVALEFGVPNELHFRALLEDGGILHTRLVVRSFERSGFVDQHDRDHVLHTNVRQLAVAHDRRFAGGDADGDRLHLIGVEGAAFENDLERIERGLNRRAHGPFLYIGAGDLVAFTEFVD